MELTRPNRASTSYSFLTFTYDSNHFLTGVKDPDGKVLESHTYHSDGSGLYCKPWLSEDRISSFRRTFGRPWGWEPRQLCRRLCLRSMGKTSWSATRANTFSLTRSWHTGFDEICGESLRFLA